MYLRIAIAYSVFFSGIFTCHEIEEHIFNTKNIEQIQIKSFIAEIIETNQTDYYAIAKKCILKT